MFVNVIHGFHYRRNINTTRESLENRSIIPGGAVVNILPANARDTSSIPGSGRSPGGGHGNTRQYSYLENPMDRGAWWATVHGVTKSRTRLSTQLTPEHTPTCTLRKFGK